MRDIRKLLPKAPHITLIAMITYSERYLYLVLCTPTEMALKIGVKRALDRP